MELITKAPKGTVDIIPGESEKWSLVEAVMTDEAELNGFSEIRTPVFEHTELFLRSVGDTTDVVEKQMYTFEDKGGRSITLRPEGTAGAVRAMLENGLYNGGYPVKLYYKTSCYRYEKPQAGRLRELHQFGVEMFGTAEPAADAQVIAMAMSIFNRLGLADDIEVSINSIGCPTCRANLVKLATRAGFKPDIRHCTDDYWATQNLVEVGMGVSLVPALDTHINLQGDLVACPIADDFAAREVGIVTRAGDHRPALGSLLEELERTSLKYLSAK